ncbi:MAG TPA: Amuc_1100 family pilus-like protein [Chthoniobacterales bacterium]|nr:Amuc_1100 family pilus-like protein [Chthoniobacterales bacterium]
MNWFRENRFLGTFFVVFGVVLVAVLWFLFSAKGDWDEAATRFSNASTELNRLDRLAPYPSADNLRKMKAHAEDYSTGLAKLKEELKTRVAPAPPMAPNEFQSRLRVTLNAVADKARANKVKLPEKFYLGFDDFVSALPSEAAAPSLGQELVELEWLMNDLLDAHVDAVTAFRRAPLSEEHSPSPTGPAATPATATNKLFQRNVVETTFVSNPSAARKVINQIAAANQHFCIIRVLQVRNEKEKGPPREGTGETSATSAAAPSPAAKTTPAPVLNFIVGTEKIETTAKIEIVRFTL